MDAEYEIFECLSDGSVRWRANVEGLLSARQKLEELAKNAVNEHFAIRLPEREVVFRADPGRKEVTLAKRVFQIAYTEELRKKRAEVLRKGGYGVLSVLGNDAAKAVLTLLRIPKREIDLFMVGHAAPDEARKDMVDWLRENYPSVRILALNPPGRSVRGADYNVLQNGPEAWLPLLASSD